TLTGLQAGDNITATYTTTATASSTVGTYVIVPVFSDPGGKLGNYTVITNGGTLTVTQAVLTVSATGHNKVYDGTTNATVTLSDNRASGDNLATAYGSAGFEDKNVGTSKPVTVSGITVSGAGAANYTFNSSASTRADITTATLTVSATGHNKVYDGTTNATETLWDSRESGD